MAAYNLMKVVEYTFDIFVEFLSKLNLCADATFYLKVCPIILGKLSK
jgi:hypothetical protein